jgi:integration host factor subunit beta
MWATLNEELMTRTELITELAKRFPQLTRQDVDVSVKAILEALGNHLAIGERIEVRGFGIFKRQTRAPRKGRNPRTGEAVHVPEKYCIRFKPSVDLHARINRR